MSLMASEGLETFRDENVRVEVDGDGEERVDVPVSKDPKKEKAEKKRLEKEEKEREKKRKEEEKRLLKEQEKKFKDTAKAEKNNASSRRQERDENKQRTGLSGLLSPSRAGVRPKNSIRGRVLLLDGSEIEVEIEKEAKAKVLVEKVCEYVNIIERDYFSCTYNTHEGKFWLIHDRKIISQIGKGDWVFEFSVKFYPPEPSILQEEVTRYQFVLQIRDDILSGRIIASKVANALLGSCTVQSELGDYDVTEFGTGIEYIQDIQFAPDQTDELLLKIAEMHRTQLHGRTPAEAELMYLENAKKLDMYGIHQQQAKDVDLFDIQVGVSADGIHVYRDGLHVNRFPWPKITKMSYKHKVFYVKIRPGAFEQYQNIIGFKMTSHTLAKRFWRLATEHHTFFRLKEPVIFDQTLFSHFGSTRMRFSGRTLYQSRIWSSTHERPSQQFERSLSTRSLTSRSLNNSSFLDRDDKKRTASLGRHGTADDYNDDYDDRQVSVVAGTAADANRVAYVKTVRPTSPDAYDPTADSQQRSPPRYSNEVYQHDVDESAAVSTGMNHNGTAADSAAVKPKKKKKKRKPEDGSQRISSLHEDSNYKATEDSRAVVKGESNPTIQHEDIDHDYEFTQAIANAADLNADMSVEQIEINPSEVAKSMTTGNTSDRIEIAPRKKKKKRTSKREAVAELS